MGTEQESILTVNAGSSSIKLALFAVTPDHSSESLERTWELTIANDGQPETIFDAISERLNGYKLEAIGHRLVHGGPDFEAPTVINPEVVDKLQGLAAFDPEHTPAALQLIEMFQQRFPDTRQVACFDTAFYHNLPAVARLLPLPRRLEALGLRRYGFHGLSYTSLMQQFTKQAGEIAAQGRIIFAHLGSGASLTAVKNGHVLDTTMSFTPASGIPMSTRSGDLDPGIVDFLSRQAGMNAEQFNHLVHFESGLLGVSELTADMKQLIERRDESPQAKDAVDLFCYQTRKAIGSLTAVLGGLDSLVFAGGIGDQAPLIRDWICQDLDYLGLKIDDQRNHNQAFLISADDSRIGVHVMHTDEAAVIADQTRQLLNQTGTE